MSRYNKQATKADIQDLVAWLERNSKGKFDANNCFSCMLAQYLRDRTNHRQSVTAGMHSINVGFNEFLVPTVIKRIAYGADAPYFGHGTFNLKFGDALKRARLELENY